jgi:hypothetical protein
MRIGQTSISFVVAIRLIYEIVERKNKHLRYDSSQLTNILVMTSAAVKQLTELRATSVSHTID